MNTNIKNDFFLYKKNKKKEKNKVMIQKLSNKINYVENKIEEGFLI